MIAVVCRQGAVRSQYVAWRLREYGVSAVAFGARPDDGAVYPLTAELARARGCELIGMPRRPVSEILPDDRVYLLDRRFLFTVPGGTGISVVDVPELDVTGLGDSEARAAIERYLDDLDAVARGILRMEDPRP